MSINTMQSLDIVVAQSTTDYGQFRYSLQNRPIDHRHLERLIAAIKNKNLLRDNPIKVNGDGVVIDGQHRLEAAKKLDLPIYFQVTEVMTIEDAASINGPVKKWTSQDFLEVYCNTGNQDYMMLREFVSRYPWMSLSSAINLTYYGDRTLIGFQSGAYKCNDIDFAEEVARGAKDFSAYISYYAEGTFLSALAQLFEHDGYVHARMVEKLKFASSMMHKCTSAVDYLKLFEAIYNYKTKEENRVYLGPMMSASKSRRPERKGRNARARRLSLLSS